MAINIKRLDNGILEPNHLSAPRDGRVYAQLPAAESIEKLENGQFAKYDYAAGEVNFTGEGEWMLVFNEEKLYDERKQAHRHFALTREYAHDGIYPRLFGVVAGDIFTTNTVVDGEYKVGDKLKVNAEGFLEVGDAGEGEHVFKVVKEYTVPDGQPGIKVQVIR